MTPNEKRRITMLAKFDNDPEKLKQHYRDMQKKSAKKGVKRGFAYATSEKQREYAKKRWSKAS